MAPSRTRSFRVMARQAAGGLTLVAVTALAALLPHAAQAAATRDQILREALLRGYTTQEAQRRYDEAYKTSNTATAAPAAGLAAGIGALAANIQRRQAEEDARARQVWAMLEARVDVPLEYQRDLDLLKDLLESNKDGRGNKFNMDARRRWIEMALHLRRGSHHLFEKRDPATAVRYLRMNAYTEDFSPWSALTLAKLYLSGIGVPQDEGEALYLLRLCTGDATPAFARSNADIAGCHLLRAQMHANGWGGPVWPQKAEESMAKVRALHGRPASDEELAALYR